MAQKKTPIQATRTKTLTPNEYIVNISYIVLPLKIRNIAIKNMVSQLDSSYTHWSNKLFILQNQSTTQYFNTTPNLIFHNLCEKHNPPPGTQQLLGLGPTFIPQQTYPKPNLYFTFQQFTRPSWLKYVFAGTSTKSF